MDIGDFGSIITAMRNTVGLFKDAVSLLPMGKNRDEIKRLIDDADKKTGAFETDAAVKLGYPICRCTWPPQIMLQKKKNIFHCDNCGADVDTTPVGAVSITSNFRRRLDHY